MIIKMLYILETNIKKYQDEKGLEKTSIVLSMSDGIARCYGLTKIKINLLLESIKIYFMKFILLEKKIFAFKNIQLNRRQFFFFFTKNNEYHFISIFIPQFFFFFFILCSE